MGRREKEKGKRGEREVANILKAHGYDARRGQQFCGFNGEADVVGMPGYHLEVKFQETTKLWEWLAQSERDARTGEVPVVVFRKSRSPWIVAMRFEDWLKKQEVEDENKSEG